ncbi:hypothetical protein [Peribacillus asahii]|uniref:hypothetical protein n=1 Tax=Peribacillus asahii TaxID=228899 RepID=UPI003803AE2E
MFKEKNQFIKKVIIGLLVILFLFQVVFVKRTSDGVFADQLVTQSLYDEWYFQQSTWAITDFPSNGKIFNGADYAWGWSYVGNSLIDMYKATRDEKYLEFFATQAEYIFTQTDEELGIESFTNSGLSLPAWSDRAYYTSGKFNYIYPVLTGMITTPILRFVDVVKENNISQYNKIADKFLIKSGEALSIHNNDKMWKDISETEGFYIGHPYGEGVVPEANKMGVPNRVFAYLAACGLYDKLTGRSIYTQRIEKSLKYFKNSLVKYDKNHDSYYWSYWDDGTVQYPWEDISHAALTVYGIFLLHEEAGFTLFNDQDLIRFKNIVYKMVKGDSPTKVRKYIHTINGEQKSYYDIEENSYYTAVLRWSFLGIYDKKVLESLDGVYKELYHQESPSVTGLFSVAMYLNTKKQLEE